MNFKSSLAVLILVFTACFYFKGVANYPAAVSIHLIILIFVPAACGAVIGYEAGRKNDAL